MTELKRSRKTLKGAVLIMVLTVMFVLIIMLLATLTVVSTANQRSYLKFEENQAYYSARSALDAYTQSLIGDSDHYLYKADGTTVVKYEYTDDKTATVKDADMTQGLGLLLDLYQIEAQDTTYGAVSNFYTNDVFADTTPEDSNYSAVLGTDYIEYEVVMPAIKSGTTDMGLMTDKNDNDDQVVTIRVEVKERAYAPYKLDDIKLIAPGTLNQAAVKAAIKTADRSKDEMIVKITATTTLMGVEGTAIVEVKTYESKQLSSSKAVTSMNDITGSNKLHTFGGFSSLSPTMNLGNNGNIIGSGFIVGNVSVSANVSNLILQPDTQLVVLGNCDFGVNDVPTLQGSGAVIYTAGTCYINRTLGSTTNLVNFISNRFMIKNDAKVYGKVFANEVDFSQVMDNKNNIEAKAYANYYIFNLSQVAVGTNTLTMDFGKVNACFSGQKGNANKGIGVYDATGKINYYNYNNYDTLNDEFVFKEPVTNTTFTLATASALTAFGFDTSSAKEVKVDYFNGSHYGNKLSDTYLKEFKLPDSLDGTYHNGEKAFKLPTIQSLYGEYFDPAAFEVEANTPAKTGRGGEFKDYSIKMIQGLEDNNHNPVVLNSVPAYTYVDWLGDYSFNGWQPVDAASKVLILQNEATLNAIRAFKATAFAYMYSAEERFDKTNKILNKYTNFVNIVPATAADKANFDSNINYVISESGMIRNTDDYFSYSGYGAIAIDATAGPIELQLGDGTKNNVTYKGTFIVYGDNEVTFLLPSLNSTGRITYNIGANGMQLVIVDSKLISSVSNISSFSNSSLLSVGPKGNTTTTPAPKINIYVGKDSQVNFTQKAFVTGYFYSPGADFYFDANGGIPHSLNYFSDASPLSVSYTNAQVNVIGSVICNSYTTQNEAAIVFIDPTKSTTKPGLPHLKFNPYQFTRK